MGRDTITTTYTVDPNTGRLQQVMVNQFIPTEPTNTIVKVSEG